MLAIKQRNKVQWFNFSCFSLLLQLADISPHIQPH